LQQTGFFFFISSPSIHRSTATEWWCRKHCNY